LAAKARNEIEAVGWVFFVVTFLILVGPLVYLSWQIVYRTAPWFAPVGMGLFSAAIAAAILSWAVNEVYQRRQRQQRLVARKQAKKRR
jgi:hypothetical protein